MTQLEFHPLADVFPLLEGEEFDALVADIQASGLREPIWMYQGQVLDGRNRIRACEKLGLDYTPRDYTGDDPLSFVISMNVRRRHLDESQRAMVAARLSNLQRGRPEKTPSIEGITQERAATLLNVGLATVERAKKVQRDAAPEVIQAVDEGKMTITAALPLTDLPREEQAAILEEVRRDATAKKPTATQMRAAVVRQQQGTTTEPAEGSGHLQAAEAARAGLPKRLSRLVTLLEALENLPDIDQVFLGIPSDCYDRVDHSLDTASETLRRLKTLWKKHRRDATEVPVRPKKSQRSQQPEKGQTQGKTKPLQTAVILKAIRKAQQPLTSEDLRQRPDVDGSRLKRNVSRLVAQGKIQEKPEGYVVVST
jgi:ParB-like chromosome segregation protein Spo0J